MTTYVNTNRVALLACSASVLALLVQSPAFAKESPEIADIAAAAQNAGARVFTPMDFERFNPRNALDMLRQVPGFSIREGDQQRGLGQANENVLVNGERLASKSEGVRDQLARITAERVERIEIVDGATLDIPGLSGQVANVITSSGGLTGRFEWRGTARAHYAKPSFTGGEISVNGKAGTVDYTLALSNQNGRGAAGGPTVISDANHALIERRDGVLRVESEYPRLSGQFKWDGPGEITGNLNLSYRRQYWDLHIDEDRIRINEADRTRNFHGKERAYDYEIGGDLEFPLGPGKLKLIGIERFEHSKYREQSLLTFEDESPTLGDSYASVSDSGEHIARGEYSWPMLGGDWQLAGEAAFNRLDREAHLGELQTDGSFSDMPFPQGSGGVHEDRYEVILTQSRQLAAGLTMQLGGGGEYSEIAQTGPDGLTRSFWRPKGSLTLAWAPKKGIDLSAKLSRKVGQLSFGDFLGRVFLDNGNANGSNYELVPQQSWEAELEAKKDLGAWGSTTLRIYSNWYEDYIDIVPVGDGYEGKGNVDKARLYGAEWTATFNLDPLGIKGAKLDTNVSLEKSSIDDPLTGVPRPLSNHYDRHAELDFRHDIPGTNLAWGAGMEYNHVQPYVRLYEVGREYEGPIYTWFFIEHKDVFGLTVNFNVFNLNNGRRYFNRVVYEGLRDEAPIAFRDDRNELVGPLFRLQVKGSF